MRDLINNLQLKRAISPQNSLSDSAIVGQIIDRQGYDSLAFLIAIGAVTEANATFAVLVEDGDDSGLSDAAAVADADLISQTPGAAPEASASFTFAHDNQVRKIGYIGNKRYVRLTITPTGNDGSPADSFMSAVAILGNAEHKPVIQGTS